MKKILKFLKDKEILCELYENLSETDKFYVGIIKSFDDKMFIFEIVSDEGNFDGYYCTSIDSIIKINYHTSYLKNIAKLKTQNNKVDKNICFDSVNLLEKFLLFTKDNKLLCKIELLNDYSNTVIGYIEKINEEILLINILNEHGNQDGICIIKIDDISCISVKTEELLSLKLLSNFRIKEE